MNAPSTSSTVGSVGGVRCSPSRSTTLVATCSAFTWSSSGASWVVKSDLAHAKGRARRKASLPTSMAAAAVSSSSTIRPISPAVVV